MPAGVVTNTDVELSTTSEVPATPPNEICEVAARLVPVTRTVLPPKVLPVAAEILDRRWIGIELSEKYSEIASKRIQAFVDDKRQQKLEFENGGH